MSFSVNIVVALHSEAKPLIEQFGLDLRHEHSEFSVYAKAPIRLIRSGIGKQSVTRATEYLVKSDKNSPCQGWLNIGIAGHRLLEVGTGVLANKIIDQASARTWYPSPFCSSEWKSSQVITVDEVELHYAEDACYDMEAAGFFPTACRSSLADLVFCYKIVSDNKTSSVQNITRSFVNQLVSSQLTNIQVLTDELDKRVKTVLDRIPQQDLPESFFNKWRFTVTQQLMMRRLLNQCSILGYEITTESESMVHCQNSRAVIHTIQKTLDSHWKPI